MGGARILKLYPKICPVCQCQGKFEIETLTQGTDASPDLVLEVNRGTNNPPAMFQVEICPKCGVLFVLSVMVKDDGRDNIQEEAAKTPEESTIQATPTTPVGV